MNGAEKKNHYTLWIGLSLIIAAICIWICSIIEIMSNEFMLTQNLPIKEIWRIEGALQWWKNAYWTTILPMWGILTLSGTAIISNQQLIRFTQTLASKTIGPTFFEKEAISSKDNNREKPLLVFQNSIKKEDNLKKAEKKLAPLREKFQLKVEKNIEKKENNIQKMRLEINDLESFYQENTKYLKPEHVN